MSSRRPVYFLRMLMITSALLFATEHAQACAVCFGDPESQMAKGVVAGMFVLLGVITAMLVGVASVGVCWMQRSRRLNRQCASEASGGSL